VNHQQQILSLASRMGADPREVELAMKLMRTGRTRLARRSYGRAPRDPRPLSRLAQSKPPHVSSQRAAGFLSGSKKVKST
jgi:hypothetical protein